MYPFVEFFGTSVPVYSVCVLLGASITSLLLAYLLRKKLLLSKYMPIALGASFGAVLGARLFGILSKGIYNLCLTGTFNLADSVRKSGIVYLGGLLGLLFMIWVLCHFKERKFGEISDILGIVIPLFHGFGRIGCYFAGCCYGCEYSGFLALPYRISVDGAWVMRIPTQLWESAFEFAIFAIHMTKYTRAKGNMALLFRYMLTYSAFRFVLEFFRGDDMRGVLYGISFSQVVCVVILICLWVQYKNKKREGIVLK